MQTPPPHSSSASAKGGDGGCGTEDDEIPRIPLSLLASPVSSPSVLIQGNAERTPLQQQRDADAIVVMMRSLLGYIICKFNEKFSSLFSSLLSFTFNSFFESSSPSPFDAFVVLIMQLLTSLRGFLETEEGHAAASKIFLSLIEIADLTASDKLKNTPLSSLPLPSKKSLLLHFLTSGPFSKMVSSDYNSYFRSSQPLLPFINIGPTKLWSFQKAFNLLEFKGDVLSSLLPSLFGSRPIFTELLMILLLALYEGVYVSETLTPPFKTIPHNLKGLPALTPPPLSLFSPGSYPSTPRFGKILEAFFKSYSEKDNTDAMVEMFCCFRQLLPFFFPASEPSLPI